MSVPLVVWVLTLAATTGKELTALEGDWALVRFVQQGRLTEVPEADRPVLTIKGGTWSMPAVGSDAQVIALDPTTRPKLIDFRGPDPRTGKTKDREGIYKVDGDTLTVAAYARADKKRPTSFDPPTEPGVNLHVYQRVKK